jgi:hypothetical protein
MVCWILDVDGEELDCLCEECYAEGMGNVDTDDSDSCWYLVDRGMPCVCGACNKMI